MNLTACALSVLNTSFAQSEQSVILTATDILAGMEMSTTLTNQNIARTYEFAGKALATKTLGLGIATIADGTLTFLVCQYIPSFAYACSEPTAQI